MENIYNKYVISLKNGFLPSEPTANNIRDIYQPWFKLCKNIQQLIVDNQLESSVISINLIDILPDTTLNEYKIIYSMLCTIQSAWIWSKGEGQHKHYVPKQIAIPLDIVSKYLGLKPLISHASIDLYNWKLIDPASEPILDNLSMAFSFTGTKSEEWFCLCMVDIEYRGSTIINAIINYAANSREDCEGASTWQDCDAQSSWQDCKITNKITLTECLNIIVDTLKVIIISLERIYEHCEPEHFYHQLRKYLNGWTNHKLFPTGMELEGVDTNVRYMGGSAAQSTLIQVIDVFLGIEHKDQYLINIREYMPVKHRLFLTEFVLKHNIKQYVLNNTKYAQSYNLCIDQLTMFRSRHLGLIYKYIMVPSKSKDLENVSENMEGTGGSHMQSMLKSFKAETLNNII